MPAALSAHLNPVLPGWLVGAVALVLLAAVAVSARVLRRKRVPGRSVVLLVALRLTGIALFVVGLLQPVLSYTRTSRPKPELAVVIDTSRSMALPDGERSRLDRATAVLRDGPLADHLRQKFTVRWYAAGPTSSAVTLDGLEATGETTRLADALRTAAEQARADGPGPRRLLLVSDGTDHGAADPAAAAAGLGVPVDVLPVGAGGTASPVLAVAEVQASPRVLLGSETRFLAVVRGDAGPAARTLTLHLAEDGRDVKAVPVTVPAGRGEARIELAHRPESPGHKRYTLRLEGPGAGADAYPVPVQVVDRTHEVLILEDTWRWEFKYLRRAVEDDPSFRFTAVLARGATTVMQFGSPDRRAPLVGLPQTAADLAPFDVFVLGDVNPARWPRGLAAEIARAVTEEGKSLVLVAGPGVGKLAEQPDLHSLLPVELGPQSGTPTEGDIAVRAPDPEAARFFVEDTSGPATLPPLERVYPSVRKRPAAHVLLEAPKLANAYGPLIVMAEQPAGRGRVLFVGTDALWQWQTLAPQDGRPTPHRAFWQRTLRALAPARPLADAGLWLLPERTRVAAGQPLTVWASALGPATGGTVSLTATLPDDRRTPLAAVADPARPGRWRATFTPTSPGTYHLAASVRVDGQPGGEAVTAIEVGPSGEMADTTPDPDTLGRIAQASGGRVIDPADPATWPADEPLPVARRETLSLWGDGWLLVLLILVLGADWLVRLFRGYV